MKYDDGEYNAASGTRAAFQDWSDALVAEGLPEPRSVSGDRTPQVQIDIFTDRYRPSSQVPGNPFNDRRYWNGQWWTRISAAGTVAVPGTGNHEKHRANDLAEPYASTGPIHSRAQEIGKRFQIVCAGLAFGEPWHWEFIGDVGQIGPAGAGTSSGDGDMDAEQDLRARDTQTVVYDLRAKLNQIIALIDPALADTQRMTYVGRDAILAVAAQLAAAPAADVTKLAGALAPLLLSKMDDAEAAQFAKAAADEIDRRERERLRQ